MVWNTVRSGLQKALADNIFQLWIEPLRCIAVEENRVVLESPDKYVSAYVRKHFCGLIEELLAEAGVEGGQLLFQEARFSAGQKEPEAKSAVTGGKRPPAKQIRLPNVPENTSRMRSMNPKYTFDEFMVGESNALAEAACRSMVDADPAFGPCLYLNAETGLGKSHLTHAVAHKVFTESPMTRVHYLTAKQFAQEMVRGIQNRAMDDFKTKYQENCDILLVEDVHTLRGKSKTQEELNDVLDFLLKSGKRVIFTSKTAPQDLEGIDSEFCSRMTSGLVADIKAPDASTRCRIVEQKAFGQKLRLTEESIEYMGSHIRGDIRRIESALRGVQARALLTGGHIDLDMVREVVAQVAGIVDPVLTAATICELVSGQFNVSMEDLRSRSRKRAISGPRQIAMYLARKHTEESLVDIGRIFNRDHSTVLHAIKVVGQRVRRDTAIHAQLELLSDKVQRM